MSLSVTSRGRGGCAIFEHRASGRRGHMPHPCCWRLAPPWLPDRPRAAHTGALLQLVPRREMWLWRFAGDEEEDHPRSELERQSVLSAVEKTVRIQSGKKLQARPRFHRHRGPTGWGELWKPGGRICLWTVLNPQILKKCVWLRGGGLISERSGSKNTARFPSVKPTYCWHLLIQCQSEGLCCLLHSTWPSPHHCHLWRPRHQC